jgi:hypothetical protein
MTDAYRKVSSYRNLMHLAYEKPAPARDTWGIDAYSGLCNKEDGSTYINGSIEKRLEKSKGYLIKALDKLQKKRGITKEGKDRLAALRAHIELARSSDSLHLVIEEALDIAAPHK